MSELTDMHTFSDIEAEIEAEKEADPTTEEARRLLLDLRRLDRTQHRPRPHRQPAPAAQPDPGELQQPAERRARAGAICSAPTTSTATS